MKKRLLSILVGVIEGLILGTWIFALSAYIPAYWQYDPRQVSQYAYNLFLVNAFSTGGLLGFIIGFIGGATFPFLTPRGYLAKSIGALGWLIITPFAYIVYWDNFLLLSTGIKILAGFITLMSFVLIIPLSDFVGGYLERLRE